MSRGPRIPQTAKRVIIEEALKHKGTNTPRMVVVERIKPLIEPYVAQMPAEESIANLISWAWNHEQSPLDEPWSLGNSLKHNIPGDENELLLALWRKSLLMGKPLTVRDAIWIVQLRDLVPSGDLLRTALWYSIRQRTRELLGEDPLDTRADDAVIAFEAMHWARDTLVRLGSIPQHASADTRASGEWMRAYSEFEELQDLVDSVPLPDRPVAVGALLVHQIWLAQFSKGAKWATMPRSAKEEVAARLWQEVVVAESHGQQLWDASRETGLEECERAAIEYCYRWQPSQELLDQVGLTLLPPKDLIVGRVWPKDQPPGRAYSRISV